MRTGDHGSERVLEHEISSLTTIRSHSTAIDGIQARSLRCRELSGGASFIAAAKERIPACIPLDVNLPGVSGLQILQDIKAKTYPALNFIISGQGDIPNAVDAIRTVRLIHREAVRDCAVVTQVRDVIAAWVQRHGDGHQDARLVPEFRAATADTTRARGAWRDRRRCLQQGGRPPTRHQSGTIEVHRARTMEARCQECRRPRAHRAKRGAWSMRRSMPLRTVESLIVAALGGAIFDLIGFPRASYQAPCWQWRLRRLLGARSSFPLRSRA